MGGEAARRGRHAATLICLVDDVIVNEGAGLVELERCAEVGQGNVFDWKCCPERVADMRHESPEPLPSGNGREHGLGKLLGSARCAGACQKVGEARGRCLVNARTQRRETVAQSHEVTLTEVALEAEANAGHPHTYRQENYEAKH